MNRVAILAATLQPQSEAAEAAKRSRKNKLLHFPEPPPRIWRTRRAALRCEPVDGPTPVGLALIENPVVQPSGTVLPEFNALRL